MRRKRLAPTRGEDRLMIKELAHLFDGDVLPVEDWQIEEVLPASHLPPPLRPALVRAGGRTETMENGFDWFETLWFATA
jgi:hypothetical protein